MMERDPKKLQNPPKMPKMCKMNCGFYADPLLEDICQKCNEQCAQANEYLNNIRGCHSSNHFGNMTCRFEATALPQQIERRPLLIEDDECSTSNHPCDERSFSDSYDDFGCDDMDAEPEILLNTCRIENPESNEPQTEIYVNAVTEETPKPNEPEDSCYCCSKKINLGVRCKCDHFFCFTHRLPENHNCTFDYKASGRSLLDKNNPKVIGEKIRKL